MTVAFGYARPRQYPAPASAVLLFALTIAQTPAQTIEGNLPSRATGSAEVIRNPARGFAQAMLEGECLSLNIHSDSGHTTDAEFEIRAKAMLARLGDSATYDVCKAMTLSYLAVALSRQDKLDEARKAADDSINLLQGSPAAARMLGPANDTLLRQSIGVLASIAIDRNNLAEADRQAARLRPLAATEKALALESGLWMSMALHRNQLNDAVRFGKETIAHWERAGYRTGDILETDLINLATALVLSSRPAEAIPFLDRAIDMSRQIPAFSERAKANALMGLAQWRAGHNTDAADRHFNSALYWVDRIPARQRPQVGREVCGVYLDYLVETRRRKEAKTVRAKLASFGPDPAQLVVDYSGARNNDR